MLFNKTDLLEALKDVLLQHNLSSSINVDEIVIDSRKAQVNKAFFALKGENNDGHNFVEQAFSIGCEVAIINDSHLFEKIKNHNLILVKDSFLALNLLAQYARARTKSKVIGITGSVGKTGVKEILKIAFSSQRKTYATTGNLNNHFGLPLTLCNIPIDCEIIILEMGMNHLGEIEHLAKLAKPDIAVITTIAPAHIGNFSNEEEIALAKSEIFLGLNQQGFALINRDNKYYDFLKKRAILANIKKENILFFGQNNQSNYRLLNLETLSFNQSLVEAKTKNDTIISYKISTTHQATINNSLIAVACLDLFDIDLQKSLDSMKNLNSGKGRGQIIELNIDNKKITLIDDSYNANVASMKAGLHYLSESKKILNKKRTVAILGDMFELGAQSDQLHLETLDFLNEYKIDFVLLAGEAMSKNVSILTNNYKIYKNSDDLALEIKNFLQDGDIVLLKGSRGMKMEKIIEKLMI